MKLGFVYMPVQNLEKDLAFYREVLGLEEAWREGELTAGLKLEGTDVGLLLDQDSDEPTAGPFLVVASVAEFYRKHRGAIDFAFEPREIPPGMYSRFADPSGNVLRVMDTSKERR